MLRAWTSLLLPFRGVRAELSEECTSQFYGGEDGSPLLQSGATTQDSRAIAFPIQNSGKMRWIFEGSKFPMALYRLEQGS